MFYASAALQCDVMVSCDLVVELHQSDHLVVVREEEEHESQVHLLEKEVIGEAVQVRAVRKDEVERHLGFIKTNAKGCHWAT